MGATNTGKITINNGVVRKYIFEKELEAYLNSGWSRGCLPLQPEVKKHLSELNKGKKLSEETKKKISNANTGKRKSDACKLKHTKKRWINDGYIEKQINIDENVPPNFIYGRLPDSEETKYRKRESAKRKVFSKKHLENLKISANLKSTRDKVNNTKRKNKTFNTSKIEDSIYVDLCSIFGDSDVKRQYSDDRYPFNCDFYILSKDLFLEINFNWTHGGKPFVENDEQCQKQLKEWSMKAEASDYYKNAIYTWTVLDVKKQNIAKQNNINYITLYEVKEWNKNLCTMF
jgi:hypothetical protein